MRQDEDRNEGGIAATSCANCGAPLQGDHCHRCGQQDLDLDRPFYRLVSEWLGNLFAFDARLWRTLGPLMIHPGRLTEEYLAGRRVRYVPPLRLYFFASVAMFLALAWSGYSIVVRTSSGEEHVLSQGRDETAAPVAEPGPAATDPGSSRETPASVSDRPETPSDSWTDRRLRALLSQPDAVVNDLYRRRLAQTLILLALTFALCTRVMFRRRHPRYLHHLVFSMHVHAAAFVGIVLVRGIGAVVTPLAGEPARAILALSLFVYLLGYVFVALRRVFGRGRLATAWRFALLGVLQLTALGFTLFGTMVLTAAFL